MKPIKRVFRLGRWEVTISFRDLGRDGTPAPNVDAVIDAVVSATGIPIRTIRGKPKPTEVYFARVLLAWNLKEICNLKMESIGQVMRKDRTTVSYECNAYPNLLKVSKRFRQLDEAVRASLVGGLVQGVRGGGPDHGAPGGGSGNCGQADEAPVLPPVQGQP